MRLKAQLAVWKARHGLTSLTAKKHGRGLQIIAKVNPEGVAGDAAISVEDMSPGEVSALLRRVADRLLACKDVDARSKSVARESDEKGVSKVISIESGVDWPAAVKHSMAHDHSATTWKGIHHEVGTSGEKVKGQKRPGGSNVVLGSGFAYSDLAKQLSELGRQFGGDPAVAQFVNTLVQTGEMPEGLGSKEQQLVAKTAALMFHREAVRNRATMLTAMMTTSSLEKGQLSWNEALGAKEEFPMAPKGAAKANRRLEQDIGMKPLDHEQPGREKRLGKTGEGDKMAGSEKKALLRWLCMELNVKKPIFNTEADLEDYVFDKAKKFYRIKQ